MLSARLQLYLCINEILVKLKLNLTAEDLVNWVFWGIFFFVIALFFLFLVTELCFYAFPLHNFMPLLWMN